MLNLKMLEANLEASREYKDFDGQQVPPLRPGPSLLSDFFFLNRESGELKWHNSPGKRESSVSHSVATQRTGHCGVVQRANETAPKIIPPKISLRALEKSEGCLN